MTDHLLPPNSTALERAASIAMSRLAEIDTPANLMWDPDTIPLAYLPWLAWALSVDDWDPDWPEARRREVVRRSFDLHRIKGTQTSVKQALAMQGYGNASITEDKDLPRIGDAGLIVGGARIEGEPVRDAWAVGDILVIGRGDLRIGGDRDLAFENQTITGTWSIGPDDPHWADYWVAVPVAIRRADADRLAGRLASVAPARCRLRGIALSGAYFALGDDQWRIGGDIGLGRSYDYEVH
ncbi:phage tail protein I [Paracoccus sediminis]|uniref:Phage tail protein I n=1 Tax=Paracoccus sediminis TaxID=1214787 RepID=A0A238ULK9_9RHOB|nr:phage tail protein I [Paracoccus sediminis]TBN53139.1 phage tail protein I [Paracoccus sediminis]SNR22851.1 phage tail protein, P2 protein I family [Paracoccus sediminis]